MIDFIKSKIEDSIIIKNKLLKNEIILSTLEQVINDIINSYKAGG